MRSIPLLALLGLLVWAGSVTAVEAPTAELGKTLFESTRLGSNGKSCSSCHPGGRGLEEISAYDDGQLKEMINFCIRDALKGRMFASDAQELDAMLAYLRSLPGQ